MTDPWFEGQDVACRAYGKGYIESIDFGGMLVRFKGWSLWYDFDGEAIGKRCDVYQLWDMEQ